MDKALYTKALSYLARRPRSEKEVRDYLLGKNKYNKIKLEKNQYDNVDEVITLLIHQRFLNDGEFARWWVEQRTRIKAKGWRVISLELAQKGISQEIIKNIQVSSKDQENDTVRNEKELARELTRKRMKKYQGMEKNELYRKLGGFLARRGFDMDVIRACIDEVIQTSV